LHSIINAPFGPYVAVPHVWASNPSLHNFDPRIGFAWDPFKNHKTALRGGFGIFHNVVGPREFGAEYYNNPPFQSGTQLLPTFAVPFVFTKATIPPPSQSFGLDYFMNTTPYVEQWNLNLQREVISNTVVSLAYVGSHSVHQIVETDANPPIPTATPNGSQFSTLVGQSIVQNAFTNSAYSALAIGHTWGWGKYESAQLSVNRHMSNNWQAQLSYTYSECRDNGSGSYLVDGGTTFANPFDFNYDNGWCAYYSRHNLTVNSLYIQPFHKNMLVAGWQVSGILSHHTGYPFTITDGVAQAFSGAGANRPNLVAGCSGNPTQGGTIQHYFNAACFSLPPVGFLGNLGRNTAIGPNVNTLDATVQKTTNVPSVSEQFAVQFRAEFFNVLNHPNFSNPSAGLCSQGTNGTCSPLATAGQITTTSTANRQIQLGLKIMF
jgi:hypothetical protein